MILADTVTKVTDTFNVLRQQQIHLRIREQTVDQAISNHYRVLEMITMNAAQVATVTKGLRNLLKDRREIKDSIAILNSVLDGDTSVAILKRREQKLKDYNAEAKSAFNKIMSSNKETS